MNGKTTPASQLIHQLYKTFPFTIPPNLSIQATTNSQNDEPIPLLKVSILNIKNNILVILIKV